MAARIIDGKAIASAIEASLQRDVADVTRRTGRPPHLVAVIVGDDPASQVYVRRKSETAARLGIRSETRRLAGSSSPADLEKVLNEIARREDVDGILLQLPLPPQFEADRLVERIPPEKDVDCFHPANVGAAAVGRGHLRPCTPQGILEILDHEKVALEGANVCIVNHSNVVGRPLAFMLLARNATVEVCHKYTKDLAAHTRHADVLITATGVPGLIGPEHVKRGAVVVDVGVSRDGGGAIRGDVKFDEVKQVAGALTPVPGGVGPLTIAMLMRNVVAAARARRGGAS